MQTRKKLHGKVLEKLFLFSLFILSYTSPCKIWNFISPIAPVLRSFGKRGAHCREEEIVFYKMNLENLGRPNLVSASRTPYVGDLNDQNGHQHLKVVINKFRLKHLSPI